MTRSEKLRLRLVAAAVTTSALVLALFVWLSVRDASHAPVDLPAPDAAALARAGRPIDAASENPGGLAAHSLVAPESADRAQGRRAGYPKPPPDTLAALSGRVVDKKSGEPVAGLALTFLSRRPKTVSVVTDEYGCFRTGVELATGVVAAMHVPDPGVAAYAARWTIEPDQFLLPHQDEGAPPFEIRLAAGSPDRLLEIDVKLPDGSPAPGASVTLTSGTKDSAGELVPDARAYEVADAHGRARFALFGTDFYEKSYRLEAEQRGTLASDVLAIDPPIGTRPREIDLFEGGVVRVRTVSDEEKPVPGVSLWISTSEGGRWTSGKNGDTDARGEMVFSGLRAACWTLSIAHPLSGQTIQKEIDLPRGGHAEFDVRLTVAGLRLALSGSVVDELGFPLAGVGVRVESAGEAPVDLETSATGGFEFWSRPSPSVVVSVGGGFLDDRFEPALFDVPFGTTNLRVHRLERLETITQAFVVVDAHTGRACPRAAIVLFHPESPGASALVRALSSAGGQAPGLQRWDAELGVAQVSYKLRDETSYAVDAPGYRRAQGRLADLVEASGPLRPLRVELEHGFERRVEVRDRITKRLLAGARFLDGNGVLGVSDSSGTVVLSAADWPAVVRVECAGYEPLVWDPAQAAFPGTLVYVEPLRVK